MKISTYVCIHPFVRPSIYPSIHLDLEHSHMDYVYNCAHAWRCPKMVVPQSGWSMMVYSGKSISR